MNTIVRMGNSWILLFVWALFFHINCVIVCCSINTNVHPSVRTCVCLAVRQGLGETWFSQPLIKIEVWFLWASLLIDVVILVFFYNFTVCDKKFSRLNFFYNFITCKTNFGFGKGDRIEYIFPWFRKSR